MAEGDNPETGPQTLDDMLDAKFPESEGSTETADDETPADDEETLDADAPDAEAEPEEDGDDPLETAEEPQHLPIDEYGELTIPVMVDGEETRVTLSEVSSGYLKQSDYTRKTQALSQREKAIEAQLSEGQQALADKQRELDEQLAGIGEQEPDWAKLSREDPLEYIAQQEAWRQKKATQETAQTRLRADRDKQLGEFQRMTAQKAVEVMPIWEDQAKFAATSDARKGAAIAAGFSEAEYEGATDFRLAVLLEKAALYDAAQGKNKLVENKVAKAPKVMRPGKSKTTAEHRGEKTFARKRNLGKPHSLDDHLKMIYGD